MPLVSQGNLERVAFNGVARLPFSPATHYAAGALDVDVGMHHGWT